MTITYLPIAKDNYFLEDMEGETLFYRYTTKRGVYLNETATLIWRLCDGSRNVDEVIATLTEFYPDNASIASDVHATLQRLVSFGALTLKTEKIGVPSAFGNENSAQS